MSPVDSRKQSPALWALYDDAATLALEIRLGAVEFDRHGINAQAGQGKNKRDAKRAIELLDALMSFVRERIEAEASGKAGGR